MKFYCTTWNGMMGGQFFTWFVNQHSGFPQPVEYVSEIFEDIGVKHVRHKLGSDINSVDKITEREKLRITNHDFSKYCSHFFVHDPLQIVQCCPSGEYTDWDLVTSVKILYFTMEDSLGELSSRPISDDIPTIQKQRRIFIEEASKHNLDYCIINSPAMLSFSEDEYQKLCDYIESPRLDNWKQLIQEYKNWIFS